MKSIVFKILAFSIMLTNGVSAMAVLRHETDSRHTDAIEMAKRINSRKAPGNLVWRPGAITQYWWDDNTWEISEYNQFTYYSDGKIKTDSYDYYQTEYFYNVKGLLSKLTVSQMDGLPLTETEYFYDEKDRLIKTVNRAAENASGYILATTSYTYDDIIEDLIIRTETTDYELYSLSNVEGIHISRNDDGHIISFSRYYILYGNDETEYDARSITYDSTGKAISVEYADKKIYDIVWESTNGQIIDNFDFDYYSSDVFFYPNRIKSATIEDSDYPGIATLEVEYNQDNDGFKAVLSSGIDVIYSTKYTPLDEYGSHHEELFHASYDAGWLDSTYDRNRTRKFDEFGNRIYEDEYLVENYIDSTDDGMYISKEKGEMTYDAQYGYPVEYLWESWETWERPNETEHVYSAERTLYSDYTNVGEDADVEMIGSTVDSTIEYYTIDGKKVSNPTKGIYIRKEGLKTTKIAK